ncbi:MAG: NAD-dependent epimerase/dehydratase family protein [Solimonas sp.]
MTLLVTGSAGHLGEALMRTLRAQGRAVRGIDRKASAYTDAVGDIADATFVRRCMDGVDAVLHTATLHKPHVATHTDADFIATNVSGTLNLLEAATAAGVRAFVFTSTTSTFGAALTPAAGEAAAWISEDVQPVPRNIYGVSKLAAEGLCELFHRRQCLPVIVLRTSRFFPEDDDNSATRSRYSTANAQANELLYRRADIEDVVTAHLCALQRAAALGYGRYIVSATAPFGTSDLAALRHDAPAVIARLYPGQPALYAAQGWMMFPGFDRVYVNTAARAALGWQPKYDYAHVLACLRAGRDFRSRLAIEVGAKGYHDTVFAEGPYPVA